MASSPDELSSDIPPDIGQALDQLESAATADHGSEQHLDADTPAGEAVALVQPAKKNLFRSLVAGIQKVCRASIKHPLWAIGGVAASAGSWCLCEYFGATVLAGLIAWALVEDV